MNSTPEQIPQGPVAAESDARKSAGRAALYGWTAALSLLLASSLTAQERKPVDAPRGDGAPRTERPANPDGAPRERAANPDAAPRERVANPDGAPRGERAANPGAPRGERPVNPDGTPLGERPVNPDGTPRIDRPANPGAPRGERPAGERGAGDRNAGGGRRAEFPEELKLTEEQQAKIREISTEIGASDAEMAKKREALLTDEQRTAQADVVQKIREGGLSRQEAGEQLAAALKLTPDQQKQMDELDAARRALGQEANTRKAAVLTDEQRGTMRKLTIAAGVTRMFSIPGPIEASDAQKTSLKALQDELGPKLIELTEKQASILTDERRAAREAAFKEARESGKDREAMAQAVEAALHLTDAEKTQLAETEQSLRELNEQIRDKIVGLLTPEQKAEFEKRGARR
ncbi:MAG TPA: hypothetical protein VGO11_00125 [Chthoniobacteraceae bacterium]|nr:hypothetical protein [Chthoniobacteraceae bacterium]